MEVSWTIILTILIVAVAMTFAITLVSVYAIYTANQRRNNILLTYRYYTNAGKPIVAHLRARKQKWKTLGEWIYIPKLRTVMQVFDQDMFDAGYRGTYHLDVTCKDDTFYPNKHRRLKSLDDKKILDFFSKEAGKSIKDAQELRNYLNSKYHLNTYEVVDGLVNPIPSVDRNAILMEMEVNDKLTKERKGFWDHPMVMFLAPLILGAVFAIIIVVLAQQYATGLVEASGQVEPSGLSAGLAEGIQNDQPPQ